MNFSFENENIDTDKDIPLELFRHQVVEYPDLLKNKNPLKNIIVLTSQPLETYRISPIDKRMGSANGPISIKKLLK